MAPDDPASELTPSIPRISESSTTAGQPMQLAWWHEDQAAMVRWLRASVRAGIAMLVVEATLWLVAGLLRANLHPQLPRLVAFVAPPLIAVPLGAVVALRAARTLTEPPQLRAPALEERFQAAAANASAELGFGVGLAVMALVLAVGSVVLAVLPPLTTDVISEAPVVVILLLLGTTLVVSLVVGKTYKQLLIRQSLRQPLLVDLPSRGREITRRLDEVQQAMVETAALAAELEEAIQAQRRVLEEEEQRARQAERDAMVGREVTESILRSWEVHQRPQRRRSFWAGLIVNVVVGFVFYALGALTQALVAPDALRNLLHR